MKSQNPTQNIVTQLPGVRVASEGESLSGEILSSGINGLDRFMDGGLSYGQVVEWGAPLGLRGRDVVLAYLAKATIQGDWCLWVHGRSQMQVYPPAWFGRGANMENMRFAVTEHPMRDLKPVLLDPFFRVVVLDHPRQFSDEDCAFLARYARQQGRLIMVVRDHLLSDKRGNIWTKLRLNCWRASASLEYYLQVVRGLSPRQLAFQI